MLATLRTLSDGKCQLIFDDMSALSTLDAFNWAQENLYTIKEFDSAQLEDMSFSKEELAEIAENILIRLVALNKNGKISKGYDAT